MKISKYLLSILFLTLTGCQPDPPSSITTADVKDITTNTASNPVLVGGSAGSWDAAFVHCPKVVVINNTFNMWYTGCASDQVHKIGHATSTDGVTWTKDPNNPVLVPGTSLWVSVGAVLFDGTKYHMWLSAGGGSSVVISHATSFDGLTWTKDVINNPVLSPESGKWDTPRVEFPAVLYDGSKFHMWYSGGNYFGWSIGYATSSDGSVWTKKSYKVIGPSAGWDSGSVSPMTVLFSSGKYRMWYFGSQTAEMGSIGYAEKTSQ